MAPKPVVEQPIKLTQADDFLVNTMEEEINIFDAINSQVDSEEVAIAIYNQVSVRRNQFNAQWSNPDE